MKNILLTVVSTLIGILFGYIIFYGFYYINFENKTKNSISSKEKFLLIDKYNKIVNHIRPEYLKHSEMIYSTINDFGNGDNILFQGDSWFMQINYPANDKAKNYKDVIIKYPSDKDLKSLKYIEQWSKPKNIGVVNAGTGSYSPSLMSVQLEVLEKDFGVKPNIIISYVDQSDLGDENCRYKSNKVYENNKLIKVGATNSLTRQAFDYTAMLKLSEINLSSKPKVLKVFQLVNYELQFEVINFFKKNYFKISNIVSDGWNARKINKCHVDDILYYLKRSKDSEIKYFKSSLEEYLNRVKNKDHIKKIYIVSFPHLENLKKMFGEKENNYTNISDLIEDVIDNNSTSFGEKVRHINFSQKIMNNKKMFGYEDYLFDKIHLKGEPHRLFISEILKQIN